MVQIQLFEKRNRNRQDAIGTLLRQIITSTEQKVSRGATHASRDTLLYIVSRTSVSGLVDTRTTVNGDAQDALALLQIVEARVYQTVAVVHSGGFRLCQSLGFRQRDILQLLLAFGCGDVDGVGDTVARGNEVVAVVAPALDIYSRTSAYSASP